MKKDTFGLDVRFYVITSFILAALGQTLICGLLLAAVMFLVRDEWASRQTMQAFFISIFSSVIITAFGVFSIFNSIPFIGGAITTLFSAISGLFNLVPLVFAIIGLFRCIKGGEANIPVFAKWARRAYGITEQKVYNYADSTSEHNGVQ